jgi:hypothetical protein
VVARDLACVVTGENADMSEACHIIPHSKSSQVCP